MTKTEVLKALERAGTAQNRKIYARHGVTSPMYGVSYANLGRIRRRIGTDQRLAEGLWASGNHDARILATMIADPSVIAARTVDAWVKDLDDYVVTGAFSGLVARAPHASVRIQKWTRARNEWVATAGWNVLTTLAMRDGALPAGELERHLETIEEEIGAAKNRVRYAMNNALIAIGTVSSALEKKAVAAARRIGEVEVDHGETGCKTPDAVTYIPKAAAHRRAKAKKTKAGRKAGRRATTKTSRA